jgi:hypothetical protein
MCLVQRIGKMECRTGKYCFLHCLRRKGKCFGDAADRTLPAMPGQRARQYDPPVFDLRWNGLGNLSQQQQI